MPTKPSEFGKFRTAVLSPGI
jgi:CTD small phosphatase-like protein 2